MTLFALVAADADGVIRSWDAGAERLFGHPAGDAVGSTLDILVPDTHREQHWNGYRALMAEGTGAELDRGAVLVPVLHHDGSVRTCAVQLILLRDPWSRPVGAMAVFTSAQPDEEGLPELPAL
ncbi:PAS domain-containing protein [Actinomadura craniellae]|nr:PAS domain-containing protein [Actinomadura craniellae]